LSDNNFENLVNEHGRQVLNTALRVLGDVNLANDVHQEVFLAIWKRWPSYNGRTNWPAYLYRTTVRKALQAARRRNGYLGAVPPERANVSRKPDGDLRAYELRQKLAGALARLPQRQADVFVLRRLEGLTTDEVAGMLGCSHQTVRVHLHRALRKLSQVLSAYLG
jgi:RNA polymerase sigma-70 factor (ECF subfamily)